MKKKNCFYASLAVLALFVVWTISVCTIDVRPVGPQDSNVGFAALNELFRNIIGANMTLYTITDWLSIVPLGIVLVFALQGVLQWITRRSLLKVDRQIFILGAFYVVVIATFCLFEMLEINYRPVLIDGILEASYPSSTTMLVMCVMPTAMMHLNGYIKTKKLKKAIMILFALFTIFMVVGRIISGVHWITDIIGGALISTSLALMYYSFAEK